DSLSGMVAEWASSVFAQRTTLLDWYAIPDALPRNFNGTGERYWADFGCFGILTELGSAICSKTTFFALFWSNKESLFRESLEKAIFHEITNRSSVTVRSERSEYGRAEK